MLSKIKYVLNEIKEKGWSKQWWIVRFFYYFGPLQFRLKKKKGEYVLDKEWDNLIVLDACRHDTLKEETYTKPESYIVSRGSSTPEWLKENFVGKQHNNIVYVSDNPWTIRLCKNNFFKHVNMWKHSMNPEDVFNKALEMNEKYPHRKLIIHFLQPHPPYINEKIFNHDLKNVIQIWQKVRDGTIPVERIYKAYKNNLKLVLPYALALANMLRGKTVITSDHGEAFGEKLHTLFPLRIYDHPTHVHIPALVKVPWVEYNNYEKSIVPDKVKERIKI